MKYLADQGLIGTEIDPKNRKMVYSVRKWFLNRTTRFVEFHIGKISEQKDPVDDVDEIEDTSQYPPAAKEYEYQQEQFREMSDDECGDLPFWTQPPQIRC